jgi:hypothetical protein
MEWFFDKTDFSLYAPLQAQDNWLDLLVRAQEEKIKPFMAILGIDPNVADAVRRQFFLLKKGNAEKYFVVDLGNIKLAPHRETNELRICEVCRNLLEEGIIPVIIGGMGEASFWFYRALSERKPKSKLAVFESGISRSNKNSLLNKIFRSEIPKPANVFFAGCQEYLCDRDALRALQDENYEVKSIGQMRKSFEDNEASLRDAEMFAFNAGVLADPFGMTPEEAVQLAWYAGTNENMSLFSLTDFSNSEKHAKVAAVMLWYFIEGAHHSFCEKPGFDAGFEIVMIPIDKKEHIAMLRSKKSGRWWYHFEAKGENIFVPASSSDYKTAVQNQIPESWWRAHNRIFFAQ